MRISREAGIWVGNMLVVGVVLAFAACMTLAAWSLSLGRPWGVVLAAAAMVVWMSASLTAVDWAADHLETEAERRERLGRR